MNNDVYILFTIIIGLCNLFEIISLCIHQISIAIMSRLIILLFLFTSEYFKKKKKNKDRIFVIHYILIICISDTILSFLFCLFIYINLYSLTVFFIAFSYVLYEYDNIYYSDNLKRIIIYNYIKNHILIFYNKLILQEVQRETEEIINIV